MNPVFVEAVKSVLIWLLSFGAGWLVSHGVWTNAQATTYVTAGAMAILSFAWAQREWILARTRMLVALMPGIHTEDAVNAHIADKTLANPTIMTPPSTVPGVPVPPKVGP